MSARRYALVGTGSRATMYLDALAGAHAGDGELVALGDTNPGRAQVHQRRLVAAGLAAPELFDPADLADVVRRLGIDRVVVTTPDRFHADYVVAALDAGADAVVEKPLTTTEDGVRRIAEAVERTGREVLVTFNYRYAPRNSALKRVIADGEIGEVTSVHFEWVLDTAHGADYFRRWHRQKENSGGLLVHKSSHHFDLVNWWIAGTPTRVYASGGLRFYGAENAAARGLGPRPPRGTSEAGRADAFSLDLAANATYRELYLENEGYDGYLRDRDVFDAGITIEDNLALVVDYAVERGTATMSYALNAHSPWEGYVVSVNGTRGRAELTVVERGSVPLADGVVDPSMHPEGVGRDETRPVSERLVVQQHFAAAREVEIPTGEGGHGGGDALLLRDVFAGPSADPLGRTASWRDGVRSVVVGIAGNASLETGRAVRTTDLDLGPGALALGAVAAS
ncbi:Gfo/Idh/MocA family protein [Kineococcus rhizosphaerae]|uniref:Oxidoreductase family protein n=1 Tax=Kineococcus rhizosphaerae TaxID=559628 RepID=A0A2T0R450_9ACTN|nr:Gfo/Idh/MocA family oxidoreductase [Kineococcus rhizosphaerae]PRY15148.1 oxidoreductase family protein [Kineococcus rhizosphaerae]